MKLIRFGERGQERPGAIDAQGTWRDLSGLIRDWSGPGLDPGALAALSAIDLSAFPAVDPKTRLGPCIGGTRKVVCIGLNYADHAAESGVEVPDEPVIFMKACATTGPDDDVHMPRGSVKTDWEVELGVVIGKTAAYVTRDEALDHVAGYCVMNDLSEREWQLEGTGQWDKGKGCDDFAPAGPWLATKDEIPDPGKLGIWLKVNDRMVQNSNTDQMVHGVAALVSYVSKFMSLQPGDIISTGTPPGVGLGMKPPTYLKVGDTVELGIDGLGVQRQRIVASV